jgi:hypothetical protein
LAFTTREEHGWRVFENRVLKEMFEEMGEDVTTGA